MDDRGDYELYWMDLQEKHMYFCRSYQKTMSHNAPSTSQSSGAGDPIALE